MKLDSSEARKTTASAISRGSPRRPRAWREMIISRISLPLSALCRTSETMGVSMKPGWIELTRMFRGAHSRAAALGGAIGRRAGHGDLAHDRGEVDHRPAAALGDGRSGVSEAQEHTVEVDRQYAPPVLHRMGHQFQEAAGNARIVDQDVEAPEAFDRPGHHALPVGLRDDV